MSFLIIGSVVDVPVVANFHVFHVVLFLTKCMLYLYLHMCTHELKRGKCRNSSGSTTNTEYV